MKGDLMKPIKQQLEERKNPIFTPEQYE